MKFKLYKSPLPISNDKLKQYKKSFILILFVPSFVSASIGNDLNNLFDNFFNNDDTPIQTDPQPEEIYIPPIQEDLDIPDINIPENPTEEDLSEIRQQIFLEEASLDDFNNRIEKQESELWGIGTKENSIKMQLTQLDTQIGINTQRLTQYSTLSKKWKEILDNTTVEKSKIKTETRIRKREYEKFMSRNYIRNEHFGASEDISTLKWLFSQKTVSQILETKQQEREKEKEQKKQLTLLKNSKRKLDAEERRSALIYSKISKLQKSIAQEKINLKDFSEGRANLLVALEQSSNDLENAIANYQTQKNESAIYLQNLHHELKKANEKVINSPATLPTNEISPIASTANETSFLSSPLRIPLKTTALFHDPEYKQKLGREHNGTDFFAPQGSDLIAPAEGVVEKIGLNNYGYSYVILKHQNDFYTIYGHLSSIDVKKGTKLKKGDLIGKTGGTPGTKGAGYFTTGPHLHLELFRNGKYLNALKYLPKIK